LCSIQQLTFVWSLSCKRHASHKEHVLLRRAEIPSQHVRIGMDLDDSAAVDISLMPASINHRFLQKYVEKMQTMLKNDPTRGVSFASERSPRTVAACTRFASVDLLAPRLPGSKPGARVPTCSSQLSTCVVVGCGCQNARRPTVTLPCG